MTKQKTNKQKRAARHRYLKCYNFQDDTWSGIARVQIKGRQTYLTIIYLWNSQWMDPKCSNIYWMVQIYRTVFSPFVWSWSFHWAISGSWGVQVISNWLESSSWQLPFRVSMPTVPRMYSSKQSLSIQRENVSPRKTTEIFNNCINEDISQKSRVEEPCAPLHLPHKEETDGGIRFSLVIE